MAGAVDTARRECNRGDDFVRVIENVALRSSESGMKSIAQPNALNVRCVTTGPCRMLEYCQNCGR